MKTIVLKAKSKEDKESVLHAFEQITVDYDAKLVCVYSNKGRLKGFEVYEIGHKAKKYYFDLLQGKLYEYFRGLEVKQ